MIFNEGNHQVTRLYCTYYTTKSDCTFVLHLVSLFQTVTYNTNIDC